ncbi:MAG: 5-formyltetrahydrofolate cyclo-ligase [Methyloprofundus sp.]|nr:5-formyltetrahydrofolate cyclo-ligase [Methyloprofundus sp.]
MDTIKAEQRRIAYDRRNAQNNRKHLSEQILALVYASASYQTAKTVLWYLHCRSEVETLEAVKIALAKKDKKIVIPYCTKDAQGENKLGLWHLESFDELQKGTWDILEPPIDRWGELAKEVNPTELDLVITPGVAFDKQGGRLGNGAGYYDRLLNQMNSQATIMAIAFESQLQAQITMQKYDVYMDAVVTEKMIYSGKGR